MSRIAELLWLASDAAGRGVGADVGRLCRLQRRYADAPFRELSPIPLPRSLKPPVRCARPPPNAASRRNTPGRRRPPRRKSSPRPCRRPPPRTVRLSGQFGWGVGRRARDFVLRAADPFAHRDHRHGAAALGRCRAPACSVCTGWPAIIVGTSDTLNILAKRYNVSPPRSCRPMATRARACCRPASN